MVFQMPEMLGTLCRFRRCRNRYYRFSAILYIFVYILVCLALWTGLQRNETNRGIIEQWIPQMKFDPFQCQKARTCTVDLSTGRWSVDLTVRPTNLATSQDMCLPLQRNHADIEMETVFDEVSVGYPSLVLSVTGWHEVVNVPSWSPKPLHVIVVPFSHQDPGWTDTMDGYFRRFTKNTLHQIVVQLTDHPSWKFVWSEMVLLHKWWQTTDIGTRQKFKRLLDNGQLELLTGSWVMADEATTNYAAVLDQMIEGHQWIKDTFNYSIRHSWSTDPFGHSSTMAYLTSQSGIDGLVLTRAHYAVRRYFSRHKYFEFFWAQEYDNVDSAIFCHVTPFLLYGIPYSCGPDRHVCCQFDFSKNNCFQGSKHADKLSVTEDNIEMLSKALWEQLQKKAELFRSNVLLLPHGDDFRFNSANEWTEQFGNLEKIFKTINDTKEMNTKIQFGTISDYFKALRSDRKGPEYRSYPSLSGDMLTYSDRSDQYWAGFYSSRPFHKHLARRLQAVLRSAEIVFTRALSVFGKTTNMTSLYSKLETARRGLALFQHHDAITGTSRSFVMADYGKMLHQSMRDASDVHRHSILQHFRRQHFQHIGRNLSDNVRLEPTENFPGSDRLPKKIVLTSGHSPRVLLVTNPFVQRRHDVIHVLVHTEHVYVTDAGGRRVRYQIGPVWRGSTTPVDNEYKLSIEVSVTPLSDVQYFVHFDGHLQSPWTRAHLANITRFTEYSNDQRNDSNTSTFLFKTTRTSSFKFSNMFFTALFSTCDGMLKAMRYHDSGRTHVVDSHLVTYTTGVRSAPLRDKSGAYIFLPDGPAEDLNIGRPIVIATHGDLLTEIRTIYRDIIHVTTIYNIEGASGMGVVMDNEINISNTFWNDVEVALRFETDVINKQEHSFCVDVNGFKMQRRKTRGKLTIQGNFHPVTQMAYIEDSNTRFTVMTTESHGSASLVSGWFDFILDRRLTHDDWRGLNEGVTDNLPTRSTFFLMFEHRTHSGVHPPTDIHTCLPTLISDEICNQLNNPLGVNVFTDTPSAEKLGFEVQQARVPLHCGITIVNIRMLANFDEALLILHRVRYDCGYRHSTDCRENAEFRLADLALYGISMTQVHETILTGVTNKRPVSLNEPIQLGHAQIKTFKFKLR